MGDLRELDSRLRPIARAFVEALEAAGVSMTVTSVLRSRAKQKQLYERYLRGESGGLPALPPGRSLHEHGLAWDMVPTHPGLHHLLPRIGRIWKLLGGQWGGDAPVGYDPVHFQAKQLL